MHRIGRIRLYLAIIFTGLFESTFLNLISVGSIRPNLMLVLIIFIGLHSDWRESLEAGIAGGLLRGIMTSGWLGMDLVIFGLGGLFAFYCKNKVYKENFLAQIILTLFMAMAASGLSFFTRIVIKNTGPVNINIWHTYALTTMILASAYTALLSPPLFFCLKKLLRIKELRF